MSGPCWRLIHVGSSYYRGSYICTCDSYVCCKYTHTVQLRCERPSNSERNKKTEQKVWNVQKSITVKYRGPWDIASTALSIKLEAAKAATTAVLWAKNIKCAKDRWIFEPSLSRNYCRLWWPPRTRRPNSCLPANKGGRSSVFFWNRFSEPLIYILHSIRGQILSTWLGG